MKPFRTWLPVVTGIAALAATGANAAQPAGATAGILIAPAPPPASEVYLDVQTQQDVRPISRFIYGLNDCDFKSRPHNLTFGRSGGNRWSAYNWETNASNAGTDYQNQNDDYLGGGDRPGGAVTGDIDAARTAGAGMLVTVPMTGYVAADKNGGGDVNQTPNYPATRFRQSPARKGGAFALAPDTTDGFVYQDEWVNFLAQSYPGAFGSTTTPIFLSLDNEPELWHTTHPRLRGSAIGSTGRNVTYAELLQRTVDYAAAIKDVSADALVFGPVNYGWQGMVRLQDAADAGGRDFVTFYLQQMAAAGAARGRRLVDVLDVHWYPEATGRSSDGTAVRVTGDNTDPGVVTARKQAPRSLWDATYTESSWITRNGTQGPLRLLPRLQAKIDASYPDTRLAITEYSYGAGGHISGAIAQADVLGIFGRHGVFAAAHWRTGTSDHAFIWGAFDMFRNYDGNNGSFGNTSVRVTNSDARNTSAYASLDSGKPGRLVLVCINKADVRQTAGISISHTLRFRTAQVYLLTGANSVPQRQADISIALTNAFQYAMPANSVTTLVMTP